MDKHELDKREYGSNYYQTRNIYDLAVLAERILADLPSAGTGPLPADAEFSIHVLAEVMLQVRVGGLRDEFMFVNRATRLYSSRAKQLIAYLARFMQSYDWTNPEDLTDWRFFSSVYLLPESEFRRGSWSPGVITVS
jgi:hypothetical protein